MPCIDREKRLERQRRYYYANRDKAMAASRLYHENNRDKMLEQRRQHRIANPTHYRTQKLMAVYGITAERYSEMAAEQYGCCAMCDEQSINLVVDHCHTEGHVRALLCNTCNAGLGFHEMPGFNEMAARYRAKHAKE